MRNLRCVGAAVLSLAVCLPSSMGQTPASAPAAGAAVESSDPVVRVWREKRAGFAKQADEIRRKGAGYLIAAQGKDGGWVGDWGPGITALCTRALAKTPGFGPAHPAVERGAAFVLKYQREDGGIYSAGGAWKNYETSVALSMLGALGEKHADVRGRAVAFVKENQWDEDEEKSIDDPWYGGAGYGRRKRPDLSNTQLMLDALRDSGLPKDDPAYQKALVFVQRCQMRAESNDQPFAKGSDQGGFIYSTARGGESKAGEIERGGRKELRAYGSMTYAGLKSMIYCGASKDDPRVQAAFDWVRANWTLQYNPGMPGRSTEGLYYYFHTFARALSAFDTLVVTDTRGEQHFWREELVAELAKRQRDDGRWVNENPRWFEGQAELTTAYALLAIAAAYDAK